MSPMFRSLFAIFVVTAFVFSAFVPATGFADSAAEIDSKADQALADLYRQSSEAKMLAERAKGILVFPKIVKAGLIVGAPILLGDRPHGIAITPDGERAYVTNITDATVSVIDVATRSVSGGPIAVGPWPAAIVFVPAVP